MLIFIIAILQIAFKLYWINNTEAVYYNQTEYIIVFIPYLKPLKISSSAKYFFFPLSSSFQTISNFPINNNEWEVL